MCCFTSLNTNKINWLHERYLWIIYNEKNLTFNERLEKDGSVSIHHQNLQKPDVEMFKVSRDLSLEVINKIFQFREGITYELRKRAQFHIPSVHSVFSGTESLKFLGPKIRVLAPNEMKQFKSVAKLRKCFSNEVL